MMYSPASSPRSFPALAERWSASGGTEGAFCPSPRSASGGQGRWSASGGTEGASSCLPRPAGEVPRLGEAEGGFISPSGCHGLLRRTIRAPSSPSAPNLSNAQAIPNPGCHHSPQSGAVVLLQPPKDTTARLRREWCHPFKTTTLPSPRGVAGETSPAQAIRATLSNRMPLLALLGFCSLLLAGCCPDNSRINMSMSEEKVMRVAEKQFEGKTTLEERFQTTARLIDWGSINRLRPLTETPVVFWNPTQREMRVPIVSGCYLGYEYSNHEAVFQFDKYGKLMSVSRDFALEREFLNDHYEPLKTVDDDPWANGEQPSGAIRFNRVTHDTLPAQFTIQSGNEAAHRVVEIAYTTTATDINRLERPVSIFTNPPTSYILIDATDPVIERSPLADAYIVQDDDFAVRSGSWRPMQAVRENLFSEFRFYYRCKILLEPHDGVTMTIGFNESEATP